MMHTTSPRIAAGLLAGLLACSGSGTDAPADQGAMDAGQQDSGLTDTGAADLGTGADAGSDAGMDASQDTGPVDTGPGPLMPTWTEQAMPAVGQRWGTLMVTVEAGDVLLSGTEFPRGDTLSDVWLRGSDGSWSEVVVTSSVPPPRYCHCAAALPGNRIVLLGGRDDGGLVGPDAWVFDVMAGSWSQVLVGSIPLGGVGCHAAWHEGTQRAIVFEGQSGAGNLGRTWSFDPGTSTFTLLDPNPAPPGRRDGNLLADPSNNRLLLFGGATVVFPATQAAHLGDLWSFDGTAWTELVIPAGPTVRRYPAAGISQSRQLLLLYGGTNEVEDFSDLWALDLNTLTWTELAPPSFPSARAAMAALYSEGDESLRIVGGLDTGRAIVFGEEWLLTLSQ